MFFRGATAAVQYNEDTSSHVSGTREFLPWLLGMTLKVRWFLD